MGVSRRELLKRGAITGGALLWATPAVQAVSMMRSAAAAVSPACVAVLSESTLTCDFFNQKQLSWTVSNPSGSGNTVYVRHQFTGCQTTGGFASAVTLPPGQSTGFTTVNFAANEACSQTIEVEVWDNCTGGSVGPGSCDVLLCTLTDTRVLTAADC